MPPPLRDMPPPLVRDLRFLEIFVKYVRNLDFGAAGENFDILNPVLTISQWILKAKCQNFRLRRLKYTVLVVFSPPQAENFDISHCISTFSLWFLKPKCQIFPPAAGQNVWGGVIANWSKIRDMSPPW